MTLEAWINRFQRPDESESYDESGTVRSETVRIVSHNVFWLQGVPFRTDQPPAPDGFIKERMVGLFEKIDADVYCLQEIQDERTADALAAALGFDVVYTRGGAYPVYGGAVLSRWPMDVLPLPDKPPLDRVIQRIRLRYSDEGSLHLSNVHLPSGRQRGREGGQIQRLKEISVALGGDETSDRPDLILGDFNESPDGACAGQLTARDYIDAALWTGGGDTSSTISGKGRGDQIWLSESIARRTRSYFVVDARRLRIPADESPSGKTYLSDHLPIGVELAVPF